MILGAILPNNSGDKRTTLHPDSIKPILDMGIDISYESGLCKGIDLEDSVLENLGAKATDRQDCIRSSDILFSKIRILTYILFFYLFEFFQKFCLQMILV